MEVSPSLGYLKTSQPIHGKSKVVSSFHRDWDLCPLECGGTQGNQSTWLMGIRVVSSPTNKLMGIVSHLVLDEEGENVITQTTKKATLSSLFINQFPPTSPQSPPPTPRTKRSAAAPRSP